MPPTARSPLNPEASKGKRIALAVQGSFGHMFYAAGILEAFREHNLEHPKEPIEFSCASGCVEMMLPLWLYFSAESEAVSIKERLRAFFAPHVAAWPKIGLAAADGDTWSDYWAGVGASAQEVCSRLLEGKLQPDLVVGAYRKWALSMIGLPGLFVFNRRYMTAKRESLQQLIDGVTVPVFSNAMNAADFKEIYLYAHPIGLTDVERSKLVGTNREGEPKRHVIPMTTELYFATGARPPLFAPIKVKGDGIEGEQYWMEGAMRCNPPLNPLVDEGADHIVLLRFFPKKMPKPRLLSELAVYERYTDAIFTVPLEKERETIETVNKLLKRFDGCPRPDAPGRGQGTAAKQIVEITDAADVSCAFETFIREELDYVTHFEANLKWETMFERGRAIGKELIEDCFGPA